MLDYQTAFSHFLPTIFFMNTAILAALATIQRGYLELHNAQREELRTEFQAELNKLKSRLIQWVTDEQAQQITGLTRNTLRSARKAADSVIIYKEDHGLRYDYDSLLAHNARRALGRGRLAKLLAQ
jgi:hypothetical protein